jgi:PAS domain S-box-containing protein
MSSKDIFDGRGEMRAIMRAFDWSTTPLGGLDQWPQSLRTTVQTMLASRYAMWMAWGPDLTFFYNDTYARVTLGKKHPWALGKPASVVWSEIWNTVEPRIRTVFNTGEATWDEGLQLFLERSGFPEETYHTFSYSPLANDDGTLEGMLCVVTEETERVLGERQMTSLRDLASNLTHAKTENGVFEAIEESLSRNDRDLPFSLVYLVDDSRSAVTLGCGTGFSGLQSLLTAPRIDLDGATTLWPIRQVLEGRQPVVVDLPSFPGKLPKGAWPEAPRQAVVLPIASRGEDAPTGVLIAGLNRYRLFDEAYSGFLELVAGQVAGGLGSARAYEQERVRAESLAEIDRAKTIFFSNVSHELRTPLTLMLGPLEDELESARRDGHSAANLQVIQRNGLRLLKLVNTLLEFSRVESGRMQAQFRPVDLVAMTSSLASIFRSAVERAGLTLVVVDKPLRQPVYVDAEMWEKIILNLISNAFKSTFQGSITVRVMEDEAHAVLEVTDTGTGIPESEVPHLFERFRRVEGARRRTHEGSGIGLALVHELVKMHGGFIEVHTEVGKGTTFRVAVPFGTAHLPADRLWAAPQASLSGAVAYITEAESWLPQEVLDADDAWLGAEVPGVGSPPEASSVLVVDDNRDMREYVASLLGKRFQVRTASNGRIALESAMAEPPDLILSDVMMPELDGFGLLAAIRSHEILRATPVILLSARAGEESRVEGMEAGADDYLVKPFSARELVARVSAHLGMAKLRRDAAERERELLAQTASERNRFQNLLLQAPALICVLSGPQHVFTLANSMYFELIGVKRGADILGKPLLEALPEVAAQGFNELLDRVYETGVPFVGREHPVTLARGQEGEMETLYLNFVYQPWRRADGTTEGVFVHAVDVTESVLARRTVEHMAASVQENEARLQAILQQVVSGICQIDARGRFAFVNDRLGEISGRSLGELQQANFFDLAHSGSRAELRRAVAALFRGSRTIELVQRWVRPDGTDLWVQQNLSAVVGEQGKTQSVVCVVQDVTAKKDAEEAMRRNEKLAAVGQLASTIAHEINNPLEAVTNLLYLMQETDSMSEMKSYLETANSELLRVSHVVTSTLRFHRQPLELSRERISTLLESAVLLYRARIRSSEIEVSTRFRDPAPILCFGAELRQVFTNLIGNAFDAARSAPVRCMYLRVRPSIMPETGAPAVRVTIADTGQGMDAATQKRIFDPFFTTKGMNGSGLGLWLSLDILRKHHAEIDVRSKPGIGTVFAMLIPSGAKNG